MKTWQVFLRRGSIWNKNWCVSFSQCVEPSRTSSSVCAVRKTWQGSAQWASAHSVLIRIPGIERNTKFNVWPKIVSYLTQFARFRSAAPSSGDNVTLYRLAKSSAPKACKISRIWHNFDRTLNVVFLLISWIFISIFRPPPAPFLIYQIRISVFRSVGQQTITEG